MKRLILTAVVVFCSTLTLWAQTEGSSPAPPTAIQAPSTMLATIAISSTITAVTRSITPALTPDDSWCEVVYSPRLACAVVDTPSLRSRSRACRASFDRG